MNEKPTKRDVAAANEICSTYRVVMRGNRMKTLSSVIARHSHPMNELLRELKQRPCESPTMMYPQCGKCLPCRARKLLEEA